MPSKSETNIHKGTREHLYEYAVVRFVPSIERDEAINIGLVMMCKRLGWVNVRFLLNLERIRILSPDYDVETLENQIKGFERVARGNSKEGGVIAGLEAHERFRWITAVKSACLQTSRPHAGLTTDLDGTFDKLFSTLVE